MRFIGCLYLLITSTLLDKFSDVVSSINNEIKENNIRKFTQQSTESRLLSRVPYSYNEGYAVWGSFFVGTVFMMGLFLIMGCEMAPAPQPKNNAHLPVVNSVATEKPIDARVNSLLEESENFKVKGRFAEAIAGYEKVIQERPDFAEPYFRLGVLYFNLGLRSKSEEFYLKAIEKEFKNPEIYFHLGYIKESEGKLQDALEWYLKAEEKGVGSAELYFNIGNVFARMNNPDRAIDYYKKAVSVNPGHMDAFINLSVISFQKGQYADASFYLDKAKELGYVPPDDYLKALADNSLSR